MIVSQWVVHHDPRWWDDAEAFHPERWLDRQPAAEVRLLSVRRRLRVCIGESFAWTEAILLLATIAQRWRFAAVTTPVREPRITLRPANLKMRVTRNH